MLHLLTKVCRLWEISQSPVQKNAWVLLQLEALAVGALDLGGVGLMGAHGDGGQAAVIGILTVVGAVVDGTLDALVGGAFAAAVGAVLHHKERLLFKEIGSRRYLFCPLSVALCTFLLFEIVI